MWGANDLKGIEARVAATTIGEEVTTVLVDAVQVQEVDGVKLTGAEADGKIDRNGIGAAAGDIEAGVEVVEEETM